MIRRLAVALGLVESDADAAYPERCLVCHRALRDIHRHGVIVFPEPTTPRPLETAMPRPAPIEVRVVR